MSLYELADLLTYAVPVVLLVGIAAGIAFFRVLNGVYRLLTGYLLLALIADSMSRFYVLVYENNLVFILLFSLCELVLFSLLYFGLVFERRRRLLLLAGVVAGTVFIVWELFNLEFLEVRRFQSYAKVVDTFLIVMLALTFFFERLQRQDRSVWLFFRLNAIIMGFFSLNLLFFLPINLLINEQSDLVFYVWLGNLFVTVAFYCLLTLEIWKNGMNHKRLRSG